MSNKFDADTYPYSVYNTDVGEVKVVFMPKDRVVLQVKLPTVVGTELARRLNVLYHSRHPIPEYNGMVELLQEVANKSYAGDVVMWNKVRDIVISLTD